MLVEKRYCIHIDDHNRFITYIRDMRLQICRSELLERRYGGSLYFINVKAKEKQHKELANRIFNTLFNEEVILARERKALWKSFFEE